MKLTYLLSVSSVLFAAGVTPKEAKSISATIRSEIENNARLRQELGFVKLSKSEQDAWLSLLEQAYKAGLANAQKAIKNRKDGVGAKDRQDASPQHGIAYVTKVDSDHGDILKLKNGAIVEVNGGFLGFIGLRKTAILFKAGRRWNVWIEGKRTYRCTMIREPQYGRARKIRRVVISEVKAGGRVLVLSDGSMLEVDEVDTVSTSIWLGASDALILDDFELVNLDESDDPVSVMPLR